MPLPAAGTAPARPTKLEPSRAKADAMSVRRAHRAPRSVADARRLHAARASRRDDLVEGGRRAPLHARGTRSTSGSTRAPSLFEWPADHTDVVERARALAASDSRGPLLDGRFPARASGALARASRVDCQPAVRQQHRRPGRPGSQPAFLRGQRPGRLGQRGGELLHARCQRDGLDGARARACCSRRKDARAASSCARSRRR